MIKKKSEYIVKLEKKKSGHGYKQNLKQKFHERMYG